MSTTITERGQISIPASIRQKYHLTPGMEMEWIEAKDGIFLFPIPEDPIAAFRGSGKTGTKQLLEARKFDKDLEGKKINRRVKK
ncbi:MAG: AbrB/MazE/SpoVT family DNA-binding domain-containing protein [Deltaproteobacteria bacterium]|nr:AbrB/MazE/SpoVT family DNA-binding domain-containing protein [Deltaproteobacteria bacterium]